MGGIKVDNDDGQEKGEDQVDYRDQKDCNGEAVGRLILGLGI